MTNNKKRKSLQTRCARCIIVMQINATVCALLVKCQPTKNRLVMRHHGWKEPCPCEADKTGTFETADLFSCIDSNISMLFQRFSILVFPPVA